MIALRRASSYFFIPPIQGCMNSLANNFNSEAVQPSNCTYTNAPTKVIIAESSGYENTHGILTKSIFDSQIGNTTRSVVHTESILTLMQYAKGASAPLISYSYSGIYNYQSISLEHYPQVLLVMPLGSNTNIELTNLTTLGIIIATGACQVGQGTQNKTAFGNGLEFWDYENGSNLIGNESSLSNPKIAAKLLQIKEGRNCTWWQARYCARATATRTEPNRPANTIWHKQNGFGIINVSSAIAYNGTIPSDPFLNNGNKYLPFIN